MPVPPDWDGGGDMGYGETEDYLLLVGGPPTEVGPAPHAIHVGEPWPNPARGQIRIEYAMQTPGEVGAVVYDVHGRRVRDLDAGNRSAGRHRLEWDGTNGAGRRVPSGVYFVHVRIGSDVHVRRSLLLN